jgi:NADH:ubiquinone oxidoreductase subunit 3 (subunit A)
MSTDTLFLLPIVFGVSLCAAMVIYLIGKKVSPKTNPENTGKKATYSCGEELPSTEVKIDSERFLVFAVYFLIFDVMAFVLAMSFYNLGLNPALFCIIVLLSVVMLISSRRY